MGDFLGVLRQHFRWSLDLSLESYEVLSDGRSVAWSDEDDRAIDLFKALLDTIDAIPPEVIGAMQELRDADPISFDKAMDGCVRAVRCGFSPANAAEFVEVLKLATQREARVDRALVHMIRLTDTRQITRYMWVHPDDER